jgi:hypothetical protein
MDKIGISRKLKYKIDTYKTLSKTIKYIDLGDSVYGEWIVYEKKTPKYHISCFGENSQSDLIIKNLIETKKLTIESIINNINQKFNKKLELGKRPFFSIKTKSELVELELNPIPIELIDN